MAKQVYLSKAYVRFSWDQIEAEHSISLIQIAEHENNLSLGQPSKMATRQDKSFISIPRTIRGG